MNPKSTWDKAVVLPAGPFRVRLLPPEVPLTIHTHWTERSRFKRLPIHDVQNTRRRARRRLAKAKSVARREKGRLAKARAKAKKVTHG